MNDLADQTLPQSWATAQLADVAEINPGLDKSEIDDELEVSFVPMPAVEAESGRMDVSGRRKFREVKKGYTAFAEGDVLFAKITPCMENGKMAVVPALQNGIGFGSTEFHVLRPRTGISAQYLYYFASAQKFRRDAEHNMTGAVGQRRVPMPYLAQHNIPVPPEGEQRRIVAKIEELFSELDKGIESLTTAREQLRVYRQSVLKAAFEGKLTGAWRAENIKKLEDAENVIARIKRQRTERHNAALCEWEAALDSWRAKGEHGAKPAKPRKPKEIAYAHVEGLPSLPSSWRWTQVSEFADLVTDGTHHTPSYTASGVPFISVKDIYDGVVHFDDCKYISAEEHGTLSQRCKPEPGDLLVTKSGTIGRLAVVPEAEFSLFVSVALIKIQSAKAEISSRWLRYVFEHHILGLNIDHDIKGGLLKNYHLEDLRLAKLPLCGFAEQEALADALDERFTVADSFAASIDEELKRVEALKQALFKTAFSGRLVSQNVTDEPASELLERIRAEREGGGATKRRNNKNGEKEAA